MLWEPICSYEIVEQFAVRAVCQVFMMYFPDWTMEASQILMVAIQWEACGDNGMAET